MTNRTFHYSFSELAVTRQDLFDVAPDQSRGLEDFPDALEHVLSVADHLIRAHGGYHVFPLDACDSNALTINGLRLETGKIISKPFQKTDFVAVFACTAGSEVQAACSDFTARGESVMAYIMDTVGTVVVEKAMDRIASELSQEAAGMGWLTTNRYSPGYCGWHVGEQQKLWSLLPENFCGISLNASSLMTPVKSISGLMGLGKNAVKTPYACSGCTMEHCSYRKRAFRN
jgi:hypothetical protein